MDVACAGSYIGYTRFSRAARRHRTEGGVVTAHFAPFRLDPLASTDGEPLLKILRNEFGDNIEYENKHVAALAVEDGLELNFDRALHTNMLRAHGMIAAASKQNLGEQMVERLFRAHFTEGLNVGDPETLASLAGQVGVTDATVDIERVRAELDRVQQLGVRQIPVFRFEGGLELSGMQSEHNLHAALTAG
jgi:predicted DsbA family dithiol-disulfide isomerase